MWQGIYGHDEIKEQFCLSLSHDRLASSYLFLGPQGVGKRSFAMQLAKALLCKAENSSSLDPCGTCDSCRLFAAGNHPDLDFVSLPPGKSRLPVELFIGDRDHRNQEGLCHNISLRPMLSARRVAIIDDADLLSTESSNCLLKTLEEPPPGAVLILIGTSRSRQLPTILSRTQVVRFQPLAQDVVRELMERNEVSAEASQLEAIAELSEGSLVKAMELANPELWEIHQNLIPQFQPDRFHPQKLLSSVTDFVNQGGKEASDRRRRLRYIFHSVVSRFRELLQNETGTSALPRSGSTLDGERYGTVPLLNALDRCLEAEIELDRNANQATLIECWLDDLAKTFRKDPLQTAQ